VVIDVARGMVEVELGDEEIAARLADWREPEPRYRRGAPTTPRWFRPRRREP
jgi:dihydroxyacid dehydratase/phosphogluconate dehydratase